VQLVKCGKGIGRTLCSPCSRLSKRACSGGDASKSGSVWLYTAGVKGRLQQTRLGRARVTSLWVEEVAMLVCQGLAAALRRTAMNLVGGPGLLPRSALCAPPPTLTWVLAMAMRCWPCALLLAGHALHQANGPALNHYRGPVDCVKGARLLATDQHHDAHPATSASESRSCA